MPISIGEKKNSNSKWWTKIIHIYFHSSPRCNFSSAHRVTFNQRPASRNKSASRWKPMDWWNLSESSGPNFFPIHPYSNQTLLPKPSNNRIISQKSQGKNYCNQSSPLPSCYWAATSSLPVISKILGGALLLYSSFSVVFVKHPRCLRRLLFFPRLQQ